MHLNSFNEEPVYDNNKVNARLILKSSFSKELRIALRTGQIVKEHKAPYPIILHMLTGKVNFGAEGKTTVIQTGDILSLEGGVPHDLKAMEDGILRLTLSRSDSTERVSQVADDSRTALI